MTGSTLLERYRRLLGVYLRPQVGRVAALALLLIGSIGLQLLNPQIIRAFLDAAQAGGVSGSLLLPGVAFLVVGMAQRAIALGADVVGENVAWRATNALRSDLLRHCLRLDLGFHKAHPPGELIDRIDGDVTSLAGFFARLVVHVIGNVLLIVGILVLLVRENWVVGLGLAIYTVLAFVLLGLLQGVAKGPWAAARQVRAEGVGFVEERISGKEDLRGVGAENHILRQFASLAQTFLERRRSAQLTGNLTFFGANYLAALAYAAGLAIGAYLYTQGLASIGTAYLIVAYVGMLADPFENIRRQAQDLQQATASVDRVEALFALSPLVREAPRATLPSGILSVEFDGVSFRYEDAVALGEGGAGNAPHPNPLPRGEGIGQANPLPQGMGIAQEDGALSDVSFRLEPGEVMGLLGRTGSGKSTLTRLLFRLYDPTEGAIRLGDVDLRDVSLANARARVGLVTQDVQLFQASIRDNLTFFSDRYSDDKIEGVLEELGLAEWLAAQPSGLDTLLAGGQGLSAGEAQLLALTRVFLKDPGLVILDEATSRLDPATGRLLERAVDRLLRGRTAVVIAHRLRTVQRADSILILERGRVVEHGSRQALARDPTSRFAGLLRTGLDAVPEEILV